MLIKRTLAERLQSGGADPLGRRIREPSAQSAGIDVWYEIVGVVADLLAHDDAPRPYLPMTPGQTQPLMLTFRLNAGAQGTVERLREIAASLDPALLVDEVTSLGERYVRFQGERITTLYVLAIVTLGVVLLSAAGMYALMSFTVNQRRREIGLRSALAPL